MLPLGVSGLLGDPWAQGWIGDQEAAAAWGNVVSGPSSPGPATQLFSPALTCAETEIYSSHSLQMSYLQGTQASSTVLSSCPNSCLSALPALLMCFTYSPPFHRFFTLMSTKA